MEGTPDGNNPDENLQNPTNAPNIVPSKYCNLECDLAYSNYFEKVMTKHIISKIIKDFDACLDKQLYTDEEMLQLDECDKAQGLDLQHSIKPLYQGLEISFFEINKILQDYGTTEKLFKSSRSVQELHDQMYLKNLKPLRTQEDCDNFSKYLLSCAKSLGKFTTLINNADTIELLGEQLRTMQCLLEKVKVKLDIMWNLQLDVSNIVHTSLVDQY